MYSVRYVDSTGMKGELDNAKRCNDQLSSRCIIIYSEERCHDAEIARGIGGELGEARRGGISRKQAFNIPN